MPPKVKKHQDLLKRNWCFFIFKKCEPSGNSERTPLQSRHGGIAGIFNIICLFFFDGVYGLKVFCAYAFSFFFFVF
jgi:hypothetical protein